MFWFCWFLFYSFQTADPPWIINMGLLWHKVKRHTTLPLSGTYQRRCVWKYPGRSMLTWERKQCRGRSWEAARPAGRKPGLYMSTKSRIEVRKKYILPQVNDFIKPHLQTLKMFFANIKTVYILKVLQTAGLFCDASHVAISEQKWYTQNKSNHDHLKSFIMSNRQMNHMFQTECHHC